MRKQETLKIQDQTNSQKYTAIAGGYQSPPRAMAVPPADQTKEWPVAPPAFKEFHGVDEAEQGEEARLAV